MNSNNKDNDSNKMTKSMERRDRETVIMKAAAGGDTSSGMLMGIAARVGN